MAVSHSDIHADSDDDFHMSVTCPMTSRCLTWFPQLSLSHLSSINTMSRLWISTLLRVISDDAVEASIRDAFPVPELSTHLHRKLDTYILDLIPGHAEKPVTKQDGGYITINRCVKSTLVHFFRRGKLLMLANCYVMLTRQYGLFGASIPNSRVSAQTNDLVTLREET